MPKEWLLEFLTSEDYNSITRKSNEHYAMIAGSGAEAKKGEEKELNVTMIASTCVLDTISGHGRYPFFMLY